MRAALLNAPNDIVLANVPRPTPQADEVLVQIEAVGVCGSDVHYYREGRIGPYVVNEPLILGHESAGTIVEVGATVSPARIGERVSIEPQRVCRMCDQCKHGRYNLCAAIRFYATPPVNGAFAEFAVIQSDFAFAIPEAMSIEAAALCEPLSVGIWANQKAGTGPGSRVLISGAGPIGIVAAQVARAFGATEIVVSDIAPERLAVAARFGATRTFNPLDGEESPEVDAFIDASGAPQAVRAGILALRPAGRAVLVGMGADDSMLPVSRIQNNELVVTGVFRYANTWPLAIELVATGAVDLDALITSRHSLAQAGEALLSAEQATTLKAIVRPQL
ncbi:sorbitol dehydrogenase [Leifsonia sp. Root227]|nr:sorbitol dehydrogenase [Leifsonia sp. Root227]